MDKSITWQAYVQAKDEILKLTFSKDCERSASEYASSFGELISISIFEKPYIESFMVKYQKYLIFLLCFSQIIILIANLLLL